MLSRFFLYVWFGAGLWVANVGRADIVWSRFEESTLASSLSGNAAFEGLSEQPSQFRSGAVTF